MTYGSLRRDIPTLQPDDDLVARLAGLAAASRPSRGGVVVPVAFGGPAGRAVVIATAIAAVSAGAAAAATHLSHARQDEPAPPGRSVGIQRPAEPSHPRAHRPVATVRTVAPTVAHHDTGVQPAAHQPTSQDVAPGPGPGPDDHTAGDDPGTHPARPRASDDSGDHGDDPSGPRDDQNTGSNDSGDDSGSRGDDGDQGSSASSGPSDE